MKQLKKQLLPVLSGVFLCVILGFSITVNAKTMTYSLDNIPEYSGEASIELNDNVPDFSGKMMKDAKSKTYESYSKLDSFGRCGVCAASIDKSLMPTEERGSIGQTKPAGWHTVKYSDQIEGNYLYNRCHLIGYQLTGENANKKNLITGTRYLNVDGMLPYENKVADYLNKSSSNKVLYRVTPVYADKDDLVCSGVHMEAMSLNDNGKAVRFNVYCYNVQPGIDIDYADGSSKLNSNWKDTLAKVKGESVKGSSSASVIAKNTASKTAALNDTTAWLSATGDKYHRINNCGRMNPDKATMTTVAAAEAAGYGRCSKCW